MMVKSFPDFCSGCRVVQLSNEPSTSTWLPPWLPARVTIVHRRRCRPLPLALHTQRHVSSKNMCTSPLSTCKDSTSLLQYQLNTEFN